MERTGGPEEFQLTFLGATKRCKLTLDDGLVVLRMREEAVIRLREAPSMCMPLGMEVGEAVAHMRPSIALNAATRAGDVDPPSGHALSKGIDSRLFD